GDSSLLEVTRSVARQVVGGPGRECHDADLRVHGRAAGQHAGVGNEQTGNAVNLAPGVDHAGRRVGAHARGSNGVERRQTQGARLQGYFLEDFYMSLDRTRVVTWHYYVSCACSVLEYL